MIPMFPHYSFDWVIKTNRTSKKFSKTFVGTILWQRVFIFALCKLKWAFTNVSIVGKLKNELKCSGVHIIDIKSLRDIFAKKFKESEPKTFLHV